MSALQAEYAAVLAAIDCLDAGDWRKAAVWLRLADEAAAEQAS